VAASLSLAVGIAWQLRPMDKAAEAMREDQVAIAASASDSSAAADAAAAAPAPAPASQDSIAGQGGAAPAAAAEDAAASAQMAKNVAVPIPPAPAELSSPPSRIAPPPPPQFAKRSNAATATDTGSLAGANRAAEPRREQVYERGYSKSQERNDAAYPAKVMAAPPPPPAPVPNFDPAPIAAPAPFPADAAPAAASAPAAPARDAAKPGNESRIRRAAREQAPASISGLSAAEAEAPAGAQPAQSQAKSETFKAAAEETKSLPPQPVREDSALDRVMVTGSRISANVEDDSKLPAAQWLDRIREYRDGGELERARESLRQFRRSHPHSRVPRDLRPLLK
jgi:Meckel syndrome type 1 protein